MSGARRGTLQARVAALSSAQREALAARLGEASGGAAIDVQTGVARLTGFVVVDPSLPTSDDALRTFLGERLPEYMIPVRFLAVERLPRTAAGKLDRSAVATLHGSELRATAASSPAPVMVDDAKPMSALASTLIAIWRDVLKVDDVGVDDDFFEIGGDSLSSIRVIARAAREGIRIAPERFFERPTIRHIASSIADSQTTAGTMSSGPDASDISDTAAALDVAPTGRAPLTPIQHWFLDAVGESRDWWNQAYVLDMGHALEGATMCAIADELTRRHDALRLRLVENDGVWQQEFPEPGHDVSCRVVSLHDIDPADCARRVAAEGEREHASLRLTEGRLFRMVLFEGVNGWRRLLVLAHHLVVDGVSWAIVLEDLATLVTQAAAGETPQLPPHTRATTSARAWALALQATAGTQAVSDAATHWLALPDDGHAMPVDVARNDSRSVADGQDIATTHADAVVVTVVVDVAETKRLLQEASRRLDAPAQALLLAALLLAWHSWTESGVLSLDLEGHGRDVLGPAMDVSRTVGWFTTVFPLRLALPGATGAMPTTAAVVRAVQRTLDALPMRGAAHGLARHLAPDVPLRAQLAARSRSNLLFNYLGTHDLALPAASRLRVLEDGSGGARSPHGSRPYLLELNARVEAGRLLISVEYARAVHQDATIRRFAALFRDALVRVADAAADDAPAGLDAAGVQAVADLLGALDDLDDEGVHDEHVPDAGVHDVT